MGYSPWGCKELDTTERLTQTHTQLDPARLRARKTKNVKWKQYCKKLNKDFKNDSHKKKI